MPLPLVLLIYNLLLPFALLVLLPASVLKMRRRGGYGRLFWQRFGWFDRPTAERLKAVSGRCRWMHAVSVGEVNVARKLMEELARAEPGIPVVLSVTTSTGYAVATDKAPAWLTVIYSPVDLPWVAGSVVRRIRPRQFILVEAEVWPNLVRRLRRGGVPVVLVNARLSPRSERRYRKFRSLAAPVFGMLDLVLVQEPEDAARWQGIGVRPDAVRVTGSIKFDQEGQPPPSPERMERFRALAQQAFGGALPRMVLAASTHAGEEEALAELWRETGGEFPDVRLLIVPRHVERRAEVQAAVLSAGFTATLRSSLTDGIGSAATGEGCGIFIVDSTGELREWQALAEVVVIGKSFLAEGGQNPVEAIAAGVPVLTGPHMENFTAVMRLLLEAGGIRQVQGLQEAGPVLKDLLTNPSTAREEAARGRAALQRHAGATQRTARELALS